MALALPSRELWLPGRQAAGRARKSWRQMLLDPLLAHLMHKDGHLAYTSTGHLAMCPDASCPDLDAVDWYLYLCPSETYGCSWCPGEEFTSTAINLGPLSTVFSTNSISYPDFSCSLLLEQFCSHSPTYQSCGPVTVDFTDVVIGIVTTVIGGGWEFDLTITATVTYPNCLGSGTATHSEIILTSTFGNPSLAPAECNSGVYSGGTYGQMNLTNTVLLCGSGGVGSGSVGFFLHDGPNVAECLGTFYVAPLADIPAC